MAFCTILSSSFSAGWSIVKLILVTILVLVLAFYATRWIARYQNNTLAEKNNIQFIESYRVGGNKMVAIAKIGTRYFALGIGKDEIHVIGELQEDELKPTDVERFTKNSKNASRKLSFQDVLSNMKNTEKNENEK